jgi:hypothetical protein
MKDITVLIPVHTIEGNFKEWFDKAIKSIQENTLKPEKVAIIHCDCEDVKSFMESYDFGELDVEFMINEGDLDFCSQINYGVSQVKTTWFSILEFDDEYSTIWFKNVEKYKDSYNKTSILLPLVVDVDEAGQFISFTNEAVWAMKFSDKLGFLDNTALLNYQNFQTSGMAMKKEDFEAVGGFKSSMKLTFVYEFLLRATYNDLQVMTIPKVGYKHTNMRVESLFWEYKNHTSDKLMPEEAKFWMDTAKKEYFFKMDRKVKYDDRTSDSEIKNVSIDSTGGVVTEIQPKTEEEAK